MYIKLYIFLIHISVCAAYFIRRHKKDRQDSIYRLIFSLFLPFFGLLMFFILFIVKKSGKSSQAAGMLKLEPFEDRAFATYRLADMRSGYGLVPFEEALLVNDNLIKRRMMLDILKTNTDSHIAGIRLALDNDDPETSHYAAAAIMEIKRRYAAYYNEIVIRYDNSPCDTEVLKGHADKLKQQIESRLLDKTSLIKVRQLYLRILEDILETCDDEKYYTDKINIEIEAGNYDAARRYLEKFGDRTDNSEKLYLLRLKLAYSQLDTKSFNSLLSEIKQFPEFSGDIQGILEFWLEDGVESL